MREIHKLILGIFCTGLLFTCDFNSSQYHRNASLSQTQIDALKKIECDRLLNRLIEIKADTFGHISRVPNNLMNFCGNVEVLTNAILWRISPIREVC